MPAPAPQGSATQRVNGASVTITADAPSGIVAGELLLAHGRYTNAVSVITDYGGFTPLDVLRQASGAGSSFIAAKVATASEPATYSFTIDAAFASVCAVQRVSGQHATLATACEAANGMTNNVAGTSFTLPATTTLGADRLIIWFAGASGGATFDWADATLDTNERYDFAGSTTRAIAASWETQASAGSTGTEDVAISVSDTFSGHVLAIAPPSSSGWSGRTAPDAILGKGGLSGSLTDIDDDPDSPDGSWLVVS